MRAASLCAGNAAAQRSQVPRISKAIRATPWTAQVIAQCPHAARAF